MAKSQDKPRDPLSAAKAEKRSEIEAVLRDADIRPDKSRTELAITDVATGIDAMAGLGGAPPVLAPVMSWLSRRDENTKKPYRAEIAAMRARARETEDTVNRLVALVSQQRDEIDALRFENERLRTALNDTDP